MILDLKRILIMFSIIIFSLFNINTLTFIDVNLLNLTTSNQSVNIDNVIEKYKPNELGNVMVLMYHNLVPTSDMEGSYARSYENFKKDLIRIHNEGYVPITMREYISGKINVPAGKTPIIITIDDGHSTDIGFLPNGEVNPDTVVGIFENVASLYPDFKPAATFYINQYTVFGDREPDKKKIDYLLSHGYDVQNHTVTHANLSKLSDEEVYKEIFDQQKFIFELTGQKEFDFALPFGVKPKNYKLLLENPNWLSPYKLRSSVNVGWNPISSIYDVDFNQYSINRITCGDDDYEMNYWFDYFVKHKDKRFISDGFENIISFPEDKKENFNYSKFKNDFKIITY